MIMHDICHSALLHIPSFKHLVGKWSVMGFLMTRSNFSDPLTERIDSLWSNWTIQANNFLEVILAIRSKT